MIQKKWLFIGVVVLTAVMGTTPLFAPLPEVLWHHVVTPAVNPIEFLIDKSEKPVDGVVITPQTTEELKKWFQTADKNYVPRVFVDKMPADFKEKGDKKLFAEVISALILRENEKIIRERMILFLLAEKKEKGLNWTPKETDYLHYLVQKYDSRAKKTETSQLTDLMMKVNTVPPVMGILQAAEATDWGKKHLESPFEQMKWLNTKNYARAPFNSLIRATESYITEMNGMPSLNMWRFSRYRSFAEGNRHIGHQAIRWLGAYKQSDPNYTDKLVKRSGEFADSVSDSVSFIKPMKMQKGQIRIGRHVFQAEFARTREEQQYGLMFRPDMPEDTAMIFIEKTPNQMGMWMKNTFVPLDVVFFDENHRISEILENLKPLDETLYRTTSPVLGMVELPAGTVQKRKIKIGKKVSF